tara:strand:+ start:140 stop:268 length:129 start_codon:yes stop_codon:yes gene_type:complete
MIRGGAKDVGEIVVRSIIEAVIKVMFMGVIVLWAITMAISKL